MDGHAAGNMAEMCSSYVCSLYEKYVLNFRGGHYWGEGKSTGRGGKELSELN